MRKWVHHGLTGLLTVLVLTSFVLSYLIWQGGGQQDTSEASFTQPDEIATSPYPQDARAMDPYQILAKAAGKSTYGVLLPNTQLYNEWMSKLLTVDVFQFHSGGSDAPPARSDSVQVGFGVVLKRKDLATKIPSIQTTFQVEASQITLYQMSPSSPVNCIFSSPDFTYHASTDMNPLTFHRFLLSATSGTEWKLWGQDGSVIPASPLKMKTMDWTLSSPPLLPLVHSFFLNPQVISRFQSSPFTEIWTDGSRAVTVDQNSSTITYDDPNTESGGTSYEDELQTVFGFVRDHGGGPRSVIAYLNADETDVPNTDTYTLLQYVDGYPLMNAIGKYQVQITTGHITQYQRPIRALSTRRTEKNVTIMAYDGLLRAIEKLAPASPPQSYDVQLGYSIVKNTSGKAQLIPTYTVSLRQVVLWTINAQTGKALQGVGQG